MSPLKLAREFVVNFLYCSECEAAIAMTEQHERRAREDSKVTFYCPHGHAQHFGKSELTRTREKLDEQTRFATEQAERAAVAERDAQISRAKLQKVQGEQAREKKRVAAGVCPCCNRTFVSLARHMKTKHPEHAA